VQYFAVVRVKTWLNVQMRPGVLQFKAGKVSLWRIVPALLFEKKRLITAIQQSLVEADSSS
jgi:hypothetical protein